MSKHLTLEQVGSRLLQAQSLVLTFHISPDGDALGSALGLMRFLQAQGKAVTVLVDDLVPKAFSFLPGINQVKAPVAGEQLEAELLVVLDASSADRIGAVADYVKAEAVLNIDHHISNTEFADFLYLDAEAAATGEIMCELFTTMGWSFDEASALSFYTAIYTDCGSFRFSNTTSKTMSLAAKLLDYGVKPNLISDQLDVRSRETVELLGKVLPTLTFEKEGKIAYVSLSNDLYNKDIPTDSFVSYPRYIEGVDVAVLFKEVEPGITRVSMRSSAADVAKIALSFGGGGHLRAAGCTINAPLEEAREQLLAALRKEF